MYYQTFRSKGPNYSQINSVWPLSHKPRWLFLFTNFISVFPMAQGLWRLEFRDTYIDDRCWASNSTQFSRPAQHPKNKRKYSTVGQKINVEASKHRSPVLVRLWGLSATAILKHQSHSPLFSTPPTLLHAAKAYNNLNRRNPKGGNNTHGRSRLTSLQRESK